MAELAQPRQPPRAHTRTHKLRRHHNADELQCEPVLGNTGGRWNLEAMSYSQQHQRDTYLFHIISDIPALWNRGLRESLPSFAQDAFGGIPKTTFANRFLGTSSRAIQRPLPLPSRAEHPFWERPLEMPGPSPEDDTASQPQAAGMRQRNGQAENAANDSAETTATDTTGIPRKPVKIKYSFPKRPERVDPDAAIWDEINASLEPLIDSLDRDSSCLLLCSGKSDFCRISPVSLGNDKGSVDHWEAMRRKACSIRGMWRWLRWVGKPRLELVELRALALHPSDPGDLCGLCEVVDLKTRIRELKDEANNYGAIPYNPGHVDDKYAGCWYDADEWRPRHGDYCDGFRTDAYAYGYEYIDCFECMYCGMEEQLERLEEIAKLEAAALWSATLDNPILAAGNSLFPSGLVKTPIEFYENLREARRTGHIRGLAQMKFTGFRVVWPEDEPGFIFTMTCCGGVLLSCLGVLGFRIAYGDWGTAYTAGAYYVALAGIVLAWFGRQGFLDVFKRMTD